MAFICDIIIVAIIVISAILGHKRGLVKTAFKCLTLIAAIALSYFFGSYAGEYIKTTDVYDTLVEKTENIISERIEEIEAKGIEDIESARASLEESDTGKTLKRLGLETDSLFEKYTQQINEGTENTKQIIAVDLAEKIMECLANALGVLVTFAASLIILKLVGFLLDKIFSLPFLKALNKTSGLLLGLVFGVVISFVLCTGIQILLPCIPENPVIYPGMEKDTVLFSFFTNINPVILLLFG